MFVYTTTVESDDDTPITVTVHARQEGALKHAATKVIEARADRGWFAEHVRRLTGGSVDNPVDVLAAWYGDYWERPDGSMVFSNHHDTLTITRTEVLS